MIVLKIIFCLEFAAGYMMNIQKACEACMAEDVSIRFDVLGQLFCFDKLCTKMNLVMLRVFLSDLQGSPNKSL